MDFFTAVRASDHPSRSAPDTADDVDSFAHAIATRYGSATSPPILLTARFSPPTRMTSSSPPISPAAASAEVLNLPSSPMANMNLGSKLLPSTSSNFIAVRPSALPEYIQDPTTLILDIRPHAAYSDARIPTALSFSVPATLLKRPLFSLQRLAAMLPSRSARAKFSEWRQASRIVVYDADAAAIPDSSNIKGLLRKFSNDSFKGDLCWLQGGFQAVWKERRDLVTTHPPTPDTEPDDDNDEPHSLSAASSLHLSNSHPVLRTKHLPRSAFSVSSTVSHQQHLTASSTRAKPPSMSLSTSMSPDASNPHVSSSADKHAFNPFFDAVRQNVELSQGITERIPLRLPARVRRRIDDLPFDWIKQIALRADPAPRYQHHRRNDFKASPAPSSPCYSSCSFVSSESDVESSSTSDDGSLPLPNPVDVAEGTEALAAQFYRIELAEQRRLMGVMEHHSKESGFLDASNLRPADTVTFPFSITAGVEKGTKNRYRHIWPFEHARVRLHKKEKSFKTLTVSQESDWDGDDDYVNASYVQPLGTKRRYIATQGPLPATFNDFWRLCWEQNVHVIVMLTREVEGAMVKCGAYWVDDEDNGTGTSKKFGPLTLKLVSKVGLPGDVDLLQGDRGKSLGLQSQGSAGGQDSFFNFPVMSGPPQRSKQRKKNRDRDKPVMIIKRTFELTHKRYHMGPRKVVHLQYLEWPDMNVPDDARGILQLIREVERGAEETWSADDDKLQRHESESGNNGTSSNLYSGSLNEVDEESGIALHALGAKERRPVLLHCSAGVGRTGGFIAVDAILDAIRREMQLENPNLDAVNMGVYDAQDHRPVQDDGSLVMTTVPIPVSATSSHQTTGPGSTRSQSDELVMHVPAVLVPPENHDLQRIDGDDGLNRQWAEDVSDRLRPKQSSPEHKFSSSGSSSASGTRSSFPFVSDSENPSVKSWNKRHGSHGRTSSSLATSISADVEDPVSLTKHSDVPLQSHPSQALHGHHTSPSSQRPRTLSAPSRDIVSRIVIGSPIPARSSSPEFGHGQDRTIALTSAVGLPSDDSAEAPSRSLSPSADESGPSGGALSSIEGFNDSHRGNAKESIDWLNRQNSNVHTSYTTSPLSQPLLDKTDQRTVYIGYKEPRQLHGIRSPATLSNFKEPVLEVVQDMREQRMSLCQSLRQYVFVHAAIVEGALMIVDEKRKNRSRKGAHGPSNPEPNLVGTIDSRAISPLPSMTPSSRAAKSAHKPSSRPRPKPPLRSVVSDGGAILSQSSTGKRMASPTELPKEGKTGEVLLSKRPSIKRKGKQHRDYGHGHSDVQYQHHTARHHQHVEQHARTLSIQMEELDGSNTLAKNTGPMSITDRMTLINHSRDAASEPMVL